MEYVTYKQIQDQIDLAYNSTGHVIRFDEAVDQLKANHKLQHSDQLPSIDFYQWNIHRPHDFREYMNQTPVNIPSVMQTKKRVLYSLERNKAPFLALDTPIQAYMQTYHSFSGLHRYDAFALYYVMSGNVKVLTESNTLLLKENTLIILAPNSAHDLQLDNSTSIVICLLIRTDIFNERFFKRIKSNTLLTTFFQNSLLTNGPGYLLFTIPPTPGFHSSVRAIFAEYYSFKPYATELCISSLETMFLHLLRTSTSEEYQNIRSEEKSNAIHAIPAILDEIHYELQTITLEGLAIKYHYDPSYLGRLIHRTTGMTYQEIINTHRVEVAKELLVTSDLSMQQIAESIGFQTASGFSKAFKKSVSVSPLRFRKKSIQENN